MPDAGVIGGAAIGGDAVSDVCIRKPSGAVKPSRSSAKLG